MLSFACLPITQLPVSRAPVISEMTSRPRPSNWLVRLLSTKGEVSLAAEKDSSLTHDRSASCKNFRLISNLTEASGIPNSIEEDSRRSAPTVSRNVTVPGDPHQ